MKFTSASFYNNTLALIFGAMGVLAFSPFDHYFAYNGLFIFISMLGFLFLLMKNNKSLAKYIGFWWGIGYFGFGVHWVYVSVAGFGGMPFAANIAIVGLLIAYLSIYPALFAYLVKKFECSNDLVLIFVAPAIWFVTEFLRGWVLTGFPWLKLGYSQVGLGLRQYAPILGVEGIDILIVLISTLSCYGLKQLPIVFRCKDNKFNLVAKKIITPLFFIVSLGLIFPNILKQIDWVYKRSDEPLTVTLVQPNIDQQIRWNAQQLGEILDKTVNLTLPYLGKSQVIIWPETAIPSIEKNQVNFLISFDEALRESNTQLITGIVDLRDNGEIFNAAILLGAEASYQLPQQFGNTLSGESRYYKHHLVPFGETVPFQSVLKHIAPFFDLPMSSFSQGNYLASNLVAKDKHFLMAICYEIILSQQLRANLTSKTDFILTISNDAWFGKSIGPWQHLQMAQMRALELGRPVIRATNNGITAFINYQGGIDKQLIQFEDGTLTKNVFPMSGFTFFAQYGHWINWLIVLLLLSIALMLCLRRK